MGSSHLQTLIAFSAATLILAPLTAARADDKPPSTPTPPAATAPSAQTPPTTPPVVAAPVPPTTIPLTVASNKKFCAYALINGKGPYSILIDSASEIMTLTPDAAKDCGLTLHDGTMQVKGPTGGYMPVQQADIDTVNIAGFTLNHPVCAVEPIKLPCDGIIGAGLLNNGVVQLDLAGNKLTTYAPDTFVADPADVCLPIQFGQVRVPVVAGEIGGIAAYFEIDTGSSAPAELLADFVKANDLTKKFTKLSQIGLNSISGSIVADVYDMKSLSLGDVTPMKFDGPISTIFLPPSKSPATAEFDGRIGIPTLTGCTITFDYPHSKIYFRPKHVEASPAP